MKIWFWWDDELLDDEGGEGGRRAGKGSPRSDEGREEEGEEGQGHPPLWASVTAAALSPTSEAWAVDDGTFEGSWHLHLQNRSHQSTLHLHHHSTLHLHLRDRVDHPILHHHLRDTQTKLKQGFIIDLINTRNTRGTRWGQGVEGIQSHCDRFVAIFKQWAEIFIVVVVVVVIKGIEKEKEARGKSGQLYPLGREEKI